MTEPISEPTTDPADDHDLSAALNAVVRDGERDPRDIAVRLAIGYLRARIPTCTAARIPLLLIEDNLANYANGIYASASGSDSFDPVRDAVAMLRRSIEVGAVPPVRKLRDAEALAEVAAELGVPSDWHEPDQQEVDVRVTDGSFDNAGHASLEKQAIIYREGTPVAEVSLATLVSWAVEAGWARKDAQRSTTSGPLTQE